MAAARRGRGDLGLANVAGTIVHFAALNAGIIALVKPLSLHGPSLWLHLPVAAGSAILFSALAWLRAGVGRLEGAFLLGIWLLYVAAAIVAG